MGTRFSRPDPEPVRESAPERMPDIETPETEPWPLPAPLPVDETPAPLPVDETPAPLPVDETPAPLPVDEIVITFGSN